MTMAARESEHYLKQVDFAKRLDKRRAAEQAEGGSSGQQTSGGEPAKRPHRLFKQRQFMGRDKPDEE